MKKIKNCTLCEKLKPSFFIVFHIIGLDGGRGPYSAGSSSDDKQKRESTVAEYPMEGGNRMSHWQTKKGRMEMGKHRTELTEFGGEMVNGGERETEEPPA
jgi:hypothetical protein